MNIFSALCESIKRLFGGNPDGVPPTDIKSASQLVEPIQPVVMTSAGNPVTATASSVATPPKTEAQLAQPAPKMETKQEAAAPATPEKPAKKTKEAKAPKEPKPAKTPEPKAAKRIKKSS